MSRVGQASRQGRAPAVVRAALYTRVSSEEQTYGHSLESQLDACRGYAERQGWEVAAIYEDPGFSATSTARPAFQRMLAAAEAGDIEAVIVLRFDRFARSLEDWIVTRRALQRRGVQLVSVTEPIEDNPIAPILEALHGGLAEWYSRDLAAKVARGKKKRAEKGLMNGMPPFGYMGSTDPAHEPPLVVPDEAEAVRWAFQAYATGSMNMIGIADELNRRGFRTRYRARRGTDESAGRSWTSASVSALLGNPIYAGHVTHHGDVMPGRHDAIITDELFMQVERLRRAARGRPAAPQRDLYLLRGLVKCVGCGASLQGNHTRSGAGYRYYRETAARRGIECDMPQVSIRADVVEAEVDRIVSRFTMPDDVRDRVIALLQDAPEDDPEGQRRRVEEQLRRLGRLYADLHIDEAEYEARRRTLEAERDRLTVPVEQAVAAAETFDVLQAAWTRATPEEKRNLALTLFEAIYLDPGRKLIVDIVVQPAFRAWLSDWKA